MPILDLAGDYGADVRPARVGSGRKPWAKDPSGAEASDGTRLDATFVNDFVAMLRALGTAYSVTQTPGDDDFLSDVLAAATAIPAAHTHDDRYFTEAETTAAISAAVAGLLNSAPGALDTLDELAAALGDDANFAATITSALAGKQPFDATLTSLAALGTAADKIAYTTAIDTWAEAAITAAGRSMIAAANAAAQTALLDVFGVAKGLVPANGGATTTFLRADGVWAAPASDSFTGGLLTSALGIIAGTEADPGLYFSGDANTGLHQPAADVLGLVTAGAMRWKVDASGNLLAEDTGTYDIGASAGNKPRNIYTSSVIYGGDHIQAGGNFTWANGTSIKNPSNGVIGLYSNGGADFGRLQFGGTTSSFPALKRSSAVLEARLADDSAYAAFKASILEAGTSVKFPDATTQTTAAVAGVEDNRLGTEANAGGFAGSPVRAATGNVLTGVGTVYDGTIGNYLVNAIYYRPLQKKVAGSWVTVSQL